MKINGTDLLIYCDGVDIAYQKECTINWEQDLPAASSKQGGGWEEHINGTRRSSCDFTALFSTTGLSDEDLISYIKDRKSVLLSIDGGGFAVVGEADLKNISINAPMEDVSGLSGSFTFSKGSYSLTGDTANLLPNPITVGNLYYETLTTSGLRITKAYNVSGAAELMSDRIDFSPGDYTFISSLTDLGSTEFPTIRITNTMGQVKSNQIALTSGINILTLTVTEELSGYLSFKNNNYADWSTSNIYLFKV